MTSLAIITLAVGKGAAAGGSLLYMLSGGGCLGAVAVFFILRMIGRK